MKYTECPRCKSKFGKVLRRVLFENDKVMLWVDGWFLVGIDTPDGQITYHINMKHLDIFDVRELNIAPKYDRHTSDDVLKRVVSLTDPTISKLFDKCY